MTLLPAETSVGRVCLRVTDLDRLAAFYRETVGLERIDRDEERAVLGAGGEPLLLLEHAPTAPERPRDAAGLFHTAIRVPDRGALGAALERVESNWRLTGASDHRVSEALYFDDPEDNGVEIYCDRPREAWPTENGRVRMDTLPLDLSALRGDSTGAVDVPDETTVGHVHLEATDLASARNFYVDRLGLSVRQTLNGALFLAAGDYHHHVGLNVWNGRTEPATGRGIDWFELVVPDHESVRKQFEDGIEARATDDGFTVEAPDGIGLRIRSVRVSNPTS